MRAIGVERWLVDDLRDDARASPHAIKLKLEKLARDPFAFFRGTLPAYVRRIRTELTGTIAVPRGLITGDLHLENFGTFLDERGEVAFDLNDFDEVTRAPLVVDLRRLAASAALVSSAPAGAASVLDGFFAALELPLDAEWTMPPAVRGLVDASRRAQRSAFLESSTVLDGRALRLRLGPNLHPPDAELAAQLEVALRPLAPARKPKLFALLDAARRLAGNGSLGRRRYLALVVGLAESPVILDLKEPRPSPWGHRASLLGARQRALQVERAARALRETSEAILGTARVHGRLFQVREHSPHGMKLAAGSLPRAELLEYGRYTGGLLARGWRRSGAELDDFAQALRAGGARKLLAQASDDACRIREEFEQFIRARERVASRLALAS